MSSAGQESREWHFYVTDMIEFGEKSRHRWRNKDHPQSITAGIQGIRCVRSCSARNSSDVKGKIWLHVAQERISKNASPSS